MSLPVEIRTVRAPNPGPMTLQGTNSYLLGVDLDDPAAPVIVVDPGPVDHDHRAALTAAGPIELILITHRHHDHTDLSATLHAQTGAPVRAADPGYCHGGPALPRHERTTLTAAGISLDVVPTPGHTDDSVSILVPGERPRVLTGDTILGQGTTVIAYPDGDLADYLTSLDVLESLGAAEVLPGHGQRLPELAAACRAYRDHRLARLDQIRLALRRLGLPPDEGVIDAVVDAVYTDLDSAVREAARRSTAAQLAYLRIRG